MDRDRFNVNKIIEESILEVQESDAALEKDDKDLLNESTELDSIVNTSFLGEFDVKATFESLNGLAKTIHGLPRVKEAGKLFEGETEFAMAKQFNGESDELTEGVIDFIKGKNNGARFIIPEASGLASGIGALQFAKKLRRYQ